MKVIYKYPLHAGLTKLTVPVDFRILAIHEQQGRAFVWIEHEEPQIDTASFQLSIAARATGERWNPEYIGTYLDSAFDLNCGEVYHYYQL